MKIAAFDSGIGGLTALAPMLKSSSAWDVHYFGDLANLPYGSKSPKRIQELTRRNVEWLLENDRYDLLIIACNSASAYALEEVTQICESYSTPVLGVVQESCRFTAKMAPRSVHVLATSATVRSATYEKSLRQFSYTGPIKQSACPLFVPLVEEGFTRGVGTDFFVKHYLGENHESGELLVLGCTHYPLLSATIQRLYPRSTLIDAGTALCKSQVIESELKGGQAKHKLQISFTDQPNSSSYLRNIMEELELYERVELKETLIESLC